jgi:hypothetical protein
MAIPFDAVVGRNVNKFGQLVETMADNSVWDGFQKVLKGFFAKPSTDFTNYGAGLKASVYKLFQFDQAQRAHYNEFMGDITALKRLGFDKDDQPYWKAGFNLLDTLPAQVIMDTPLEKWNADDMAAASVEWIRGMKADETNAAEMVLKYDNRYLDEDRIDPEAIRGWLGTLSDLQKKHLQRLSTNLHNIREMAVESKRHQLMTEWNTYSEIAKRSGQELKPLSEKAINRRIRKDLGPTVTSYIPHFVYDMFQDDRMAGHLWRLAGESQDVADLGREVGSIIRTMPDQEILDAQGMTKEKWLAAELNQRVFNGDGDYMEWMPTAQRLLRHTPRLASIGNDGAAIAREMNLHMYIKFHQRRMSDSVNEGLLNPFTRMEDYVAPILKDRYMGPAVAGVRFAALGLEDVDKAASARLNAWLNSMTGTKQPYGIEYIMRASPGAARFINRANSLATNAIYTKFLYANTSTALLNLTQPFQFGMGKFGWAAAPGAFKLMMDPKYGHVMDSLERAALTESSIGALLGGRAFHSAIDGFKFYSGGEHYGFTKQIGELTQNLRLAGSQEEANRYMRGAAFDVLKSAGSFMALAELAVRQFTSTGAAIRSALQQLEEQGGRMAMSGAGELQVVMPDGKLVDVFEELALSAPKNPKMVSVFDEVAGESEMLNWNRIVLDATADNADINFVMSSANYSQFERNVRDYLPIIGPAAATFTNYQMSVANRLAADVMTLARAGGKAMGASLKQPMRSGDAARAAQRLLRYQAGTLLIGGPFAFGAAIDSALGIAHALDPSIPESSDDPGVKGVLRGLEKFSLTGVTGIDYSSRVGPELPTGFVTGGRFLDNGLAEWVSDAWVGFSPVSKGRPEDKAKARYNWLGAFAKYFDAESGYEYGANPVGRSNPLMPMFLYNMAQMVVDLHAQQNGEPLRNELGYGVELPPGEEEIIKRGFLGRTILKREMMKRVAQDRPELAEELKSLRQNFYRAMVEKDIGAARAVNKRMHELVPIEGEDDTLVHPDLNYDQGDARNYMLKKYGTIEIRQLMNASPSMKRVEARNALADIKMLGGMDERGNIDWAKIESSDNPELTGAAIRLQIALGGD